MRFLPTPTRPFGPLWLVALAAAPLAGCAGSAPQLLAERDARYAVERERDSLQAIVTVQDERLEAYRDSLETVRLNTRPARPTTPTTPPPSRPVMADPTRPDTEPSFADTLYVDELFAPASANLTETGMAILDRVAYEISRYSASAPVRVEGHGDPNPPGPSIRERFPSNFDLSSARASAVARYFVEKGMAERRLSVIGYAANKPIASNDTPQGRAQNRRVIVVVE